MYLNDNETRLYLEVLFIVFLPIIVILWHFPISVKHISLNILITVMWKKSWKV